MPRFRVRTLLIALAVVAFLLGGWLEFLRLKQYSDLYKRMAWGFGGNVRLRHRDLAKAKQRLKQLMESPDADPVQLELLGVKCDRLRANIAANYNIAKIYEHAATHPWETPPLVAETLENVEDWPIIKPYLTNSPEAPLPSAFAPRPTEPDPEAPYPSPSGP
jgi:hypothetical protein